MTDLCLNLMHCILNVDILNSFETIFFIQNKIIFTIKRFQAMLRLHLSKEKSSENIFNFF